MDTLENALRKIGGVVREARVQEEIKKIWAPTELGLDGAIGSLDNDARRPIIVQGSQLPTFLAQFTGKKIVFTYRDEDVLYYTHKSVSGQSVFIRSRPTDNDRERRYPMEA